MEGKEGILKVFEDEERAVENSLAVTVQTVLQLSSDTAFRSDYDGEWS